MTQEELLERKVNIEQRFNEFNLELMRLQGEHRLVSQLLEGKTNDVAEEVKSETPAKRIRKVKNA